MDNINLIEASDLCSISTISVIYLIALNNAVLANFHFRFPRLN